jgi:serine/threonine protein kinase
MKIIEAQVKPPSSSNISPELVALIMWLLQKDPINRPSIKQIVNEVGE